MRFTEDHKNILRGSLQKILIHYGCIPGKPNWSCIPSRHTNSKNDLSVKDDVCSCHCGLKGDVFNVIAEMENLNIKRDFYKIIKLGLELIGESNISPTKPEFDRRYIKESKAKILIDNTKIYDELTDIITLHFKKMKSYNYKYFYSREIDKIELFSRYRIIVENPKKIIPSYLLPGVNNLYAYRNIIPVWENQKIVNCLLRRDDYFSTKNNKLLNLKGLPLKIFNSGYVNYSVKDSIIFICEGIFDSLSIENISFKSMALNSVSMVSKFIKLLEENIDQLKQNNVKFIICMDSDNAGVKAKEALNEGIQILGLDCVSIIINNYKDINDFHVSNRDLFVQKMNKLVDLVDKRV